jgi:hypothetical protein
MKTHLEPLAVAANVTQASDVRLDHVTVTFASLRHIFSQPHVPKEVGQAILNSLDKRWIKGNQDTFIAAVYYNPRYRHHLFDSNEPGLQAPGLYPVFKRLFVRIFPGVALARKEFLHANHTYAQCLGPLTPEVMCLDELDDGEAGFVC